MKERKLRLASRCPRNKHLVLDQEKIDKARKLFKAKSDTEAIELALERAIAEQERISRSWKAHEDFIKSGIEIEDVFQRTTETTFS